jgi:hypothetical protein
MWRGSFGCAASILPSSSFLRRWVIHEENPIAGFVCSEAELPPVYIYDPGQEDASGIFTNALAIARSATVIC